MRKDLVEELYRENYRSAFAYIFSLCGNKAITEDIVSQAFEKAIVTISDDVPNFRFWLIRVCKNLLIDLKRREKKMSATPIDDFDLAASDDVPKEVMDKIAHADLYRAIYDLNESEKEVIGLFYFSNLNIKEISMLTGSSTGNIKIKLHRARLKLRKIMEGKNGF